MFVLMCNKSDCVIMHQEDYQFNRGRSTYIRLDPLDFCNEVVPPIGKTSLSSETAYSTRGCPDIKPSCSKTHALTAHYMENDHRNENGIAEDLSDLTNYNMFSWVGRTEKHDIKFICMWNDCYRRLESLQELEYHLDDHLQQTINHVVNNTDFFFCRCSIKSCDKTFTSEQEYRSHMDVHLYHAETQHIGFTIMAEREEIADCTSCGFEPKLNIVHNGEPLYCFFDGCELPFYDIAEYIKHVNHHVNYIEGETISGHTGKQFRCSWGDCKSVFKNKGHLRSHIRHHSGEKFCACPFCGVFCANVTRFYDHIIRRVQGSATCNFCRKTFFDLRILKEHCEKHRSSKQCPLCNVILKNESDLRRHISRKHETPLYEYKCLECGRTFAGETEYNSHAAVHAPPSLVCETCGKEFRWKKQLAMHRKEHDGSAIPDPYTCHICSDTRYTTGTSLSKHFKKKHNLSVPNGFSRFQYKRCGDGLLRLQTSHLLTGQLAETIARVKATPS